MSLARPYWRQFALAALCLAVATAVTLSLPIFIQGLVDATVVHKDPALMTNLLLIKQALARLMQGRTVIIIAHRLSTVEHADLIAVLERGRVVERGTHRELLEAGGIYHKLYMRSAIPLRPADSASITDLEVLARA